MNSISIKPINGLLQHCFFIPAYQRGYRWTKEQVEDLLNDINEFSPKEIPNSNEKTWYCLQPIVVKKKGENQWEVIDGQQRLTTIYLILYYLNQGGIEKLFELKYETRENSANYLQNELREGKIDDTNIDYYFISSAYSTICKWFKNEGNSFNIETFKSHTKIIWYEVLENDNSIDIFTRINSGKIPLTNAELIKALFLNSSNFKNADEEKIRLKQLEIATEWDRIEYALQDDAFWYFINKEENNLETRIEFIFDLIAEKSNKNDEYFTFRHFSDKFKTKSKEEITENWKEIKQYFQTLEEWYQDRELYHKIGYLITIGVDIKKILNDKKEKTKGDFINWVDEKIKEKISEKPIEELEYGKPKDNEQLINILLLHNVISVLNSDDHSLRFPFNKYKDNERGGWSLEHIHAQNSDDITEKEDFKEWLKAIDADTFTDEIKKKIECFYGDEKEEKIPELVEKISNLFGESDIHSIENMALISKNDNSKLNNGLFPVKRERIIELEKNGAFIPLATKKVFQKYFPGCTKQLSKWEEKDRKSYLNDIKETLKNLLST